MKKENQPDYGNWVPKAMMKMMIALTILLLCAESLCLFVLHHTLLSILFGVLLLLFLLFTLYMWRCRVLFDFRQGNLMGDIHQFLVEHLAWDGKGTLLDIGCGSGALTIRCAKRFPYAQLVGIDFWGAEWSYAKEQCERNALLEGVRDRITFQKGDAAKLAFSDETFNAAVSNFVFHEVRSQPDKCQLIREALRVVKPGGAFAFQDLFSQKKLYGDIDLLLRQLLAEGIQEIHYIPFSDIDGFIPAFVQAPWMLSGVGLIYGIK